MTKGQPDTCIRAINEYHNVTVYTSKYDTFELPFRYTSLFKGNGP